MLSSALRGNACHRAFYNLQKSLLHALARNVARDGYVLALSRDLVDFVDIDDAALGAFHVVIGVLDELEQNVFNVLADIARFGERGRVRDGERHVQNLCERARQQGFSAARRS